MNLTVLNNLVAFLKRVPLTGEEAIAWCEARAAVDAQIALLTTPAPTAASETEKT